jgi:hypothetical protein
VARRVGIPLLTLLLVVSLVLAPPYFVDVRRDGEITSWVAFMLAAGTALLSALWLLALFLTYSSRRSKHTT